MAKLIGPLHSTEARGRVDSLVYGTWRGIRYVRSYTAPEFASPDPREAQKARVAAANAAWKLLSNTQRSQWHDYAQLHPRIDWSGVPVRISGYNAFVSCYTICLRAGGTPLSSPPTTPLPLSLNSLVATQVGNDIEISWTYPAQLTAHTYVVQIRRYGPGSLGKKPDSHWTTIIAHEGIATSPYTDPLTIDGRYGYWARVIDADTGETSQYLLADVIFALSDYVGPNSPGEAHDDGRAGDTDWTDISNVLTSDDNYASCAIVPPATGPYFCSVSEFGFAGTLPNNAIILGIVVEISKWADSAIVYDLDSPRLYDNTGEFIGVNRASATPWPTVDDDTYTVYGSPSDLWGTTGLTGADINELGFGMDFTCSADPAESYTAYIDHIRMTVYYTMP